MAFIFTMRSTPASSMHRHSTSSLPVIDEDEALSSPAAPSIPPRASNRPSHKHFGLGVPPHFDSDGSPPAYNQFDPQGAEGPNGEKLAEVRRKLAREVGENRHIAKRGGWRRIALIALILIIFITAVAVGVALGLRSRKATSSNDTQSNNPSSTDSGTSTPSDDTSSLTGPLSGSPSSSLPSNRTNKLSFPAGSYSIPTYLSTIATNCTTAASTWTCYPYSTYAQSRSSSTALFDWIISSVPGTTSNFTISSTPNVFSILFTNATLLLLDKGTDSEHYFFQTTVNKPTKPAGQLGDSTAQATCYFNATTFQASLYTRMPKSFPAALGNTTTAADSPGAYQPWPHAVKIEQVTGARAGTPECVDPFGKSMGDFAVEDGTQLCDCLYLNTGT